MEEARKSPTLARVAEAGCGSWRGSAVDSIARWWISSLACGGDRDAARRPGGTHLSNKHPTRTQLTNDVPARACIHAGRVAWRASIARTATVHLQSRACWPRNEAGSDPVQKARFKNFTMGA